MLRCPRQEICPSVVPQPVDGHILCARVAIDIYVAVAHEIHSDVALPKEQRDKQRRDVLPLHGANGAFLHVSGMSTHCLASTDRIVAEEIPQ